MCNVQAWVGDVEHAANAVADAVSPIASQVSNVVGDVAGAVIDPVGAAVSHAVRPVGEAVSNVVKDAGVIIDPIGSAISAVAGDAIGTIASPIGKAISTAADSVSNALGGDGGGEQSPQDRLIDAQNRSLSAQETAMNGIFDLYKRMQPLQEEQLKFGLESGRTAFAQSQADREYALGRRNALTGVQDAMIADAKGFNTDARREELAGQANADVTSAFSNARDQSARNFARMGIDPTSGKYRAADNQMAVQQAAATAHAMNNARSQSRAEGRALQDRAAGTLAGYPTMGMQTTGAGAQYASNGIGLANAGAAGMSSGFGSAAQIAGSMGANASNMWGQQANYQRQGQAQEGEMWGSLLGAGAKLGAVALASDRRLKECIELVGQDPATRLNLYEFSYIKDPDRRRYRGVMADEVRVNFPHAVVPGENGFDFVNYQAIGLEMVEV